MFDNASKPKKELEISEKIYMFYLFELSLKIQFMTCSFLACHLYLMLDCRDVMSRLGAFTSIGFVR